MFAQVCCGEKSMNGGCGELKFLYCSCSEVADNDSVNPAHSL